MEKARRSAWRGWLFLLPSFLGITVFYLIPFVRSLFYTFTQGITVRKFVLFDNFAELFHNPSFLLAAGNTLLFLLCGVPLLLVLSLVISLMLQNMRHAWQRWALLTPMVIPVAAFLLGWQSILGEDGFVNQLLVWLGGQHIDFFGNKAAFPMMLFLYVLKNLGYMTVILTGAISTVPSEYKEAFRLDSSSNARYVVHILLPLISPMFFFVFVISVMNGLKIFREVFVLYGNSPPTSVYMLQSFMNNNFYKLNYQRLSAAAFLVIAGIALLIWLFLKVQNRVSIDENG